MPRGTDTFEFTLSLARGFMPAPRPNATPQAQAARPAALPAPRAPDRRAQAACG